MNRHSPRQEFLSAPMGSPGKLYALAAVGLAVFLVALIVTREAPSGYVAQAALELRPLGGGHSSRAGLSQRWHDKLLADELLAGALRRARQGISTSEIAELTIAELRERMHVEPGGDNPRAATVHLLGRTPAEAERLLQAVVEEAIVAEQAPFASQPTLSELLRVRGRIDSALTTTRERRGALESFLQRHFDALGSGREELIAQLTREREQLVSTPSAPASAAEQIYVEAEGTLPDASDDASAATEAVAAPTDTQVAPGRTQLNPRHQQLAAQIAENKRRQEELAETHTWAHPEVRQLIDEQLALERELRRTPAILDDRATLPTSDAPSFDLAPPQNEPTAPASGPPAFNPSIEFPPAGRHPYPTAPATSSPPLVEEGAGERFPAEQAVSPPLSQIEQLVVRLLGDEDRAEYDQLRGAYASASDELVQAIAAERELQAQPQTTPSAALALAEPVRIVGRIGGELSSKQILIWGGLAGVLACLVSYYTPDAEGSPTLNSPADIDERLGLSTVAVIPADDLPHRTLGGETQPVNRTASASEHAAVTPGAPLPLAVGGALRTAEIALVALALLFVLGLFRATPYADQFGGNPLQTIIDACAWWKG